MKDVDFFTPGASPRLPAASTAASSSTSTTTDRNQSNMEMKPAFDDGRAGPTPQQQVFCRTSQDVNADAPNMISACDPDTIRALLDERDALVAEVERLRAERVLWRDEG